MWTIELYVYKLRDFWQYLFKILYILIMLLFHNQTNSDFNVSMINIDTEVTQATLFFWLPVIEKLPQQ